MAVPALVSKSDLPRVTAVLTSFNRRDKTLACLRALANSALSAGVNLRAILVDDASTDGTAITVREEFPWAEVIDGDGSLYWNRGMYVAYGLALEHQADYFIWINDDTELFTVAIERMIEQSRQLEVVLRRPVIVVGSTADIQSGQLTYGGAVAQSRLRRFTYHRVWNELTPVACDTMNGNCVLIPRSIALRVGNLDPAYEHAMGDTDYALRARHAGFEIFVASGIIGYCSGNPAAGTFTDSSIPWRRRWKMILDRKGLPPRSWLHFTRKHGGILWPLYFIWPYTKLLFAGVHRSRSRAS